MVTNASLPGGPVPAGASGPAPGLFDGGGQTGALMLTIDWRSTSLGPIEHWPQSLKTIIPALLASRFAMRVVWGPEYVMLYNDAYLPVLGQDKHPRAMGAPTAHSFPELWHLVEPLFQRVYGGEAVALTDYHLPVHRNGYLEECYFTLSYSPLRDDAGRVAGLLGVISETTDRVLAERRLGTLRALGTHAASTSSNGLTEIAAGAVATISKNVPDVPYALLYLAAEGDTADDTVRLAAAEGLERGAAATPERISLDDPASRWPLGRAQSATLVVETPAETFGPLPGGIWPEPSPRAAVGPLSRPGLRGCLIVGTSARRAFDESYAGFVGLAGDQLAVVLAAAQAHEGERRALAEAHWQRSRLESLFEQTPAAICVLRGRDHVFEFANPRYRQLIGDADVIGKPLREALPTAAPVVLPLLDQVFASGEPFFGNELPVELQRRGQRGQCYFNFIYQPLYDLDKTIEGVAVVAFEVTEQVNARHESETLARALEATNRDLDQFAYVASHDLKAPLRGTASLSAWIEEALTDQMTDETRRQMDLLRGRVHRLEALIDGILNYSRAGRVREKVEAVDVGALLADCRDLLAPQPPAIIQFAPDMPTVMTERVPLQQVFMNLISNALKHAGRPDVLVQITWQEAGDFYDFAIRDNGPGIPKQFHERVWVIFQTLQPRDRVEGTGIGLSVVKKLVESRGGQVSIGSAAGEGTTFHIVWPKTSKEFR